MVLGTASSRYVGAGIGVLVGLLVPIPEGSYCGSLIL